MRRHRWFSSLGTAAIVGLAVVGCATYRSPSGEPLLAALAVEGLTVEAIAMEGASPAEREWFEALIQTRASAAAQRAALEHRLAAIVEAAPAARPEIHRLVGRVSLPMALPSELRGSRAAFTEGDLATARVELRDGRGELVAAADSRVEWGEVRWTTGGPKTRRAKDPNLALLDAAELAVERAVQRLIRELRARRHGSSAMKRVRGERDKVIVLSVAGVVEIRSS